MSLNVVLGKSNTGKSEYLYKQIMACEDEKTQAILFVPPSCKLIAEEEYLKHTNKKAIISTKITNIERYVSQNIDKGKLYENKKYLPELSKKMLIRKVIMENPEVFKVFSKVKDTIGFADKIADYLLKFKDLENIVDIRKYNEQDFLKTKLDEFLQIYNIVNENLKNRFVTSIDEIGFYIDNVCEQKEKLENTSIFIDYYNNFTNIEYQIIKQFVLNAKEVYITLDIDKEKFLNNETQIYNTSYDTLSKLKQICAETGTQMTFKYCNEEKEKTKEDIKFLANTLLDDNKKIYDGQVENIEIALVPNIYKEIQYVASSINGYIKQGYSYKDFGIYTNNLDTYEIQLKKVFGQFKLPIYINEKRSLKNENIVIHILQVLDIVINGYGKSVEGILNILKTNLYKISNEDVSLLENYIVEFGIRAFDFKKEFILNTEDEKYDLKALNDIREYIVTVVQDLKGKLATKTNTQDISSEIYEYISNNLLQQYEEYLVLTKDISINEYNFKKQVLKKIYEIMDLMSLAYEKMTLNEYVEIFKYAIKEESLDTIPAKVDQIEVIDINKTRGTSKKIGYIIGCYDGGLPKVQEEDNIFTDIELLKLKSKNIDLKQTSYERQNMQMFNIYQVLNKIREKLIFTFPSTLSSGSSCRPSSIIQDVKKVLGISITSVETNKDNLVEDFMKLLTQIITLDKEINESEISDMYNRYLLYKEIPELKEIMQYIRKDEPLSKTTLSKIYKKDINSSVSRLEQYQRCPFAYFSKYILKLNPPKEYNMSSLDTGSFMHEVIEKFSKYIVSKNYAWENIVLDEKIQEVCMNKVDEIIDDIFEKKYFKYLTSSRYIVLKARIKKSMKRTIFAISDSFNHSEFRPLGYEISFEKDGVFAPIEVELDAGYKMLLKGKIDRVDSCKVNEDTYLRIVDYKSSDKNLKLSDIKMGLSLQLMTYMCAMLENKEKINKEGLVLPAALSYFTISNKILNIPNYEKDENKIKEMVKKALKLKGIYISDIEILEKLDNNVQDGKESYLEVSSRTMNNREKILPKDIFEEECKNVRKILKQIGQQIITGNVNICPNKKVKDVCKYCEYITICRKNSKN